MKLTQLAKAPELIKITIDDEDTVREFGESLDFWIYDRTPIDVFVRMATLKQEDFGSMVEAVNKLVLDEDGTAIVKDGLMIPTHILTRVISKVVETLGK
jgi:hypothetical protein